MKEQDRSGIYSKNAVLAPGGVMPPSAGTNVFDEVNDPGTLINPYANLLRAMGELSADMEAADPETPPPSGDEVKPFSQSKRLDADGGPTAWDQPDMAGTGVTKPKSRKQDKSANETKAKERSSPSGGETAKPKPSHRTSPSDHTQERGAEEPGDHRDGMASLAAAVIGGGTVATAAADTMVKAANVQLVGKEQEGGILPHHSGEYGGTADRAGGQPGVPG